MSNQTHVILVADRSGSMQRIRTEAENGIKTFLQEQKDGEGDLRVTLIEFDDVINTVYEDEEIQFVPDYELIPRGMTALLDAVSRGLGYAEALPEFDTALVVVITDGQENASRESTYDEVNERVKAFSSSQNRDVIFLSSDLDAAKDAQKLGVRGDLHMSYEPTGMGVTNAYAAVSSYVQSRRAGDSDAKI